MTLSQAVKSKHAKIASIVIEIVGLQTARGRLLFFAIVSMGIFFAPYDWLAHLSIWQHLGIPAPSIGLTRAYWRLMHGDIIGAYHRNPLIFAVLVIGLPLLAMDIYKLWGQRRRHK